MIYLKDIHRRLKVLSESSEVGSKLNLYLEMSESAIQSGNVNNIIRAIKTCVDDTTNSFLLETMFDLFDNLYLNSDDPVQIERYGRMITEKAVSKTRDAKDTQTNLKRKLGRIKTAVQTKASNNIQDIADAINQAIKGAQGNFQTNTAPIKQRVQSAIPQQKKKDNTKAKLEAYLKVYSEMERECTKVIYCNRILENYNTISKRFNIDRIITENAGKNGMYDTAVSICRLIETYDYPDKVKFNTALETVWYGCEKNYITGVREEYVTAITDYFLAKGNNSFMCSKLLEASMIVETSDYNGDLGFDTNYDTSSKKLKDNLNEADIQHQILEYFNQDYYSLIPSDVLTTVVKEETDFNKIFNQFKASDEEHKETKLQWLIRKIYSKNPQDIIDGTPNLLGYVRAIFVLGTLAINPVIAAVAAISQIFLSLHTERKETEAMLKCFKNEIDQSKTKLKSTTDPDQKARLKKYINELEAGYKKIDEYYETQLTDAELDKKYDEDSDAEDTFASIIDDDNDDSSEDDDFGNMDDFDLGDMDSFDESFIFTMGVLADRFDKIPIKEFGRDQISNILAHSRVYTELADIAVRMPAIINKSDLLSVLEEQIEAEKAKAIQNESTVYSIERINMDSAKNTIIYSEGKEYIPANMTQQAKLLDATIYALEALNTINTACDYYHPLIEGSFTNTITMACEKVKKAFTKLSDQEKTISKNIDVAANNARKSLDKAFTNDNREAVIKGSIIPSASKCIKLGITGAALCIVDPVLAVIGALGYLGISKNYQAKERQLVLDELDTELKMCEKYIEIAESKNDMKALKKLLTIQKELQRQQQRIKYKMKVNFNQSTFDSTASPNTMNDPDHN